MTYFTPTQHAGVTADPTAIIALYNYERTRFITDLGPGLSAEPEEHYKLAFCGLFAYDHTPYGPEGGLLTDPLTTVLAAPSMDCDNYAALTWRLFEILAPGHSTKVYAVGWDGGALSNHAQLVAHMPAGMMMLDPTVGFIQVGYMYDWYTSSKPCNAYYSKSFYSERNDGTAWLNGKVIAAYAGGLIKPSDILYTFGDLTNFQTQPNPMDWATPVRAGIRY